MDILQLAGNTPMVNIEGIYAKLEAYNPTGSIKDRMAVHIISRAMERGILKPGMEIIEVTSGNTGIAFAAISARLGHRFTAIMPEFVSRERIEMLKLFGANVVLTPAAEDMEGAVRRYEEMVKDRRDVFLPRQFENPDNIEAHRLGTGREIIEQMEGQLDAFVAGTGTGGTLIGVALALRDAGIESRIVAVEPAESAVISGKTRIPGMHMIQGIGEGFVPPIIENNRHLIDEIVDIPSKDAIDMSKFIARRYGLLVGISSGANILAAMEIKKKYGFDRVVTVLPDRGERYMSIYLN